LPTPLEWTPVHRRYFCPLHSRCFHTFTKTTLVQTMISASSSAHHAWSFSMATISAEELKRLLSALDTTGHLYRLDQLVEQGHRRRVLEALHAVALEREGELDGVKPAPVLLPTVEQPGQLPTPDPAYDPHWDRGYVPRGPYAPMDNGSLSADALLPSFPRDPPAVTALRLSDLVLANDFGNAPVPVVVCVETLDQASPPVPLWGDDDLETETTPSLAAPPEPSAAPATLPELILPAPGLPPEGFEPPILGLKVRSLNQAWPRRLQLPVFQTQTKRIRFVFGFRPINWDFVYCTSE
jgi:hypothetical protein